MNFDDNQKSAEKNNTPSQCLICCDMPADAVLMECGHSGICFQCGIALCTNVYDHNMHVVRKHIERNRGDSDLSKINLQDANCHICRKHISSIF